jgi:hypothetical protein
MPIHAAKASMLGSSGLIILTQARPCASCLLLLEVLGSPMLVYVYQLVRNLGNIYAQSMSCEHWEGLPYKYPSEAGGKWKGYHCADIKLRAICIQLS